MNIKTLTILLFMSSNLCAQSAWQELSPRQQKILLPFESAWQDMDIKAKRTLIANTDKWLQMTPMQRRESEQKLKLFKQKTPEQQQRIKDRIERFKQLSPQEKKQLRKAQKRFKNMNSTQRQQLRTRFNNMPPEQRKQVLRKKVRQQQRKRFISEFDITKRKPLIQMFKELPKDARLKLSKYLKNLSPESRHSTTLELLDMQSSARLEYINSIE